MPRRNSGSVVLPFVAVAIALVLAAGGLFGTRPLAAQGQSDLESRHQRLLPLFEVAGVVFTDADETTGRLTVGVLHRSMRGPVQARLTALGVPFQSVDIVETPEILPLTTLRDFVRPVEGGLQIRFSGYLCSLSFNVQLPDGRLGFVTASHCSDRQGETEGTAYYQPLNQIENEYIGEEIFDPPYLRDANGCPKGRRCRYSDANLSAASPSAGNGLGRIARTTGPNNGDLTIVGGFSINGGGTAGVHDTANKVGRTTGWTQGEVTRTCVNTGVSGSNLVLFCQTFVENEAQIVAGGDSGSPVFKIKGRNGASLLGTLWGGNSAGTLFVYSPLAQVMNELGNFAY